MENQFLKKALEKNKSYNVFILYSTLFWAFFELAGSAITAYTETNVDRTISWLDPQPLTSSQFMGVNPLYIIYLFLYLILFGNI